MADTISDAALDALDRRFAAGARVRVRRRDGHAVLAVDTRSCAAELALQGAQVLSWTPSGATDVLWCAPLPPAGSGTAIRGGIPVCWPWFGPHPTDPRQPQHGLARTTLWTIDDVSCSDEQVRATLTCRLSGAELTIEARFGRELHLALITRDPGPAPLTITEALHTYIRVGDPRLVAVDGLAGSTYRDNTNAGRLGRQEGLLRFGRETIAVFDDAPARVEIIDPSLGRRIEIERGSGGRSTVVWNPGASAHKIADLPAGGERQFVCVESGNVGSAAVTIEPGASHRLDVTYRLLGPG